MGRKALTDEAVAALAPGLYWDSVCTGLGVRVGKRTRSFVFQCSVKGADRRVPIEAADLSAARAEAVRLRAMVERGELPPTRKDRDKATAASPTAPTLAEAWERLNVEHLPKKSRGHQHNIRDTFERLVLHSRAGAPAGTLSLAGIPVAALTWDHVDAWHRSMSSTPVQANRALAVLRLALKFCRRWGWLPAGAGNVAEDHDMHRETKNRRPFTDAELRAIGAALPGEPNAALRVGMLVCILTGLRPKEISRLRWCDLGADGLVTLPDSKTGPRGAVLSERAERLLRTLDAVADNPYIFRGRRPGAPLGTTGGKRDEHPFGAPWDRLRTRTKRTDLPSLYSGRHTWVTTAAGCKVPDDVRRVLAGHTGSTGSAHAVYLHRSADLRAVADQVAEKLALRLGLPALDADAPVADAALAASAAA